MQNSPRLELHPGLYLMLAFMVLLVPLKWCFAFLFASIFHELCHYIAVRLCGGSVSLLRISNYGATMDACGLSSPKAFLCILAGPLGSLLLIVFARWFPRLALCAALQSCFNLLPLPNLDGGHALNHICHWILPNKSAKALSRCIQNGFLVVFAAAGFYGTFILKFGLLPVIISAALIHKNANGKIPCK
jgi:Zn-dependent protease